MFHFDVSSAVPLNSSAQASVQPPAGGGGGGGVEPQLAPAMLIQFRLKPAVLK